MATQMLSVPRAVAAWFEALQPMALSEAVPDPSATAVFSADMVVGFCDIGALASPRVDALTGPIVDLFRRAHAHGIRDFALLQDTHDHDALEFAAFPPHCVQGTDESQAIPELATLPFAETFTIIEKNTLSPAYGTALDGWLDGRPSMRRAIVVGNCTDLCVYHAASHLRMRANARRIPGFEVIVPADLVQTFDLPEAVAAESGALAHDGDFFHVVFLYHLALTGVRVVRALT